jgi:hypothetical protein
MAERMRERGLAKDELAAKNDMVGKAEHGRQAHPIMVATFLLER